LGRGSLKKNGTEKKVVVGMVHERRGGWGGKKAEETKAEHEYLLGSRRHLIPVRRVEEGYCSAAKPSDKGICKTRLGSPVYAEKGKKLRLKYLTYLYEETQEERKSQKDE